MTHPFNVPDEYAQGLVKAGHSLMQALLGAPVTPAPSQAAQAPGRDGAAGQPELAQLQLGYLRNMYLENNLKTPGRLTVAGEAVDLGRIDMPSYALATQEDHIVPWRSAYQTTQLLGGRSQFVLGASGHIAGVINPASKNKRSYWTGGRQGADAEAWLAGATETPGSWWTHWFKWLAPRTGKAVPARRKLGSRKYRVIEPAPGRYVKVRAVSPMPVGGQATDP